MDTLPSYLTVDIVGTCSCSCIYCPEGRGRNVQPQRLMPREEFRRFIGPVLPHLRRLELFNWSEPFIHPDLLDIVAYVKRENPSIKLRLSTNGMVNRPEVLAGLVREQLDALTITISGLDDETHQLYHRGAKLARVLDTLAVLLVEKERLQAELPRIRIRYLRFPFNFVSQRKVDKFFQHYFGKLASHVENVRVREGYLCELTASPEEIKEAYGIDLTQEHWRATYLAPECKLAFENPVVRTDGAVFPCCGLPYRDEFIMGHLSEKGFEEVWNGPEYRQFRQLLKQGTNPVCNHCRLLLPLTPIVCDRYFLHRVISRFKQGWRARRLRPPN